MVICRNRAKLTTNKNMHICHIFAYIYISRVPQKLTNHPSKKMLVGRLQKNSLLQNMVPFFQGKNNTRGRVGYHWVPPLAPLYRGIQLLECPFFTQHGDVTNDGRNALHVAAQAGQGQIVSSFRWGEICEPKGDRGILWLVLWRV